jgi:prevent-host-death family protein
MTRVTATELARNLSDLLNRVRYRGERLEVVRGGEVIAEVAPAVGGSASVRRLFEVLEGLPKRDLAFADDLERIQAEQPKLDGSPWDT